MEMTLNTISHLGAKQSTCSGGPTGQKTCIQNTALYWSSMAANDAEAAAFPIASASDPHASTAFKIILHNFMS